MKKKYERPQIKVIEAVKKQELLCASGDNPYWCDEQPSESEWWKK